MTVNIVCFSGGLGNQMFQYALYKELQSKGKSDVKANLAEYQNNAKRKFELPRVFPDIRLENDENDIYTKRKTAYLKLRTGRNWVAYFNYHLLFCCIYFKEKEDSVYDKRVYKLRNAAIYGYWQTEKYFSNIREELRKDFTFQYGEKQLEKIRNKFLNDEKAVAIHIRRGDYLKKPTIYGNLSEGSYYKDAIEIMDSKLDGAHLIFFSDDIPWVKRHYDFPDAIYISEEMFERYESWYDMCLMSSCAHNIIANSSFSWWAAWLNQNQNKIVIAPKKWLNDRETPDIWCDGWIVL